MPRRDAAPRDAAPRTTARTLAAALLAMLAVSSVLHAQTPSSPDSIWPTYGGDPGGQRYSPAAQITRDNVQHLQPAWTFHTGANAHGAGHTGSFEATPILFHGALYFASPFDEVFALDPETGRKLWSFDPLIDWDRNLGIVTSRGVASWSSASPTPNAPTCASRIFFGTLDGRLMALDAATGTPCIDFGSKGTVDLTQNVDYRKGDDYAVTSPPAVVGDVVVVGSGVGDGFRVDMERGDVRGFDVRTGKLLWTWEPIPWANAQKLRTGAANTWSVIAADPEHGLIFLPTGSASPDYYGGLRPGDNRDADSVVALDAKTGKKVWSFQTVHHNIWDYDVPAEPLLFTFRGNTPALAIATKMGFVFVLNRLTGEPLYPITETPVPPSDVPGELVSPTQPIPALPSLSPTTLDLTKQLGGSAANDAFCRNVLSHLRYNGLYTPPSLQGTVQFPSNLGGVNWGSAALDPATGILYANTNRLPFMVKLQKRPLLSPEGYASVIHITLAIFALLIIALAFRTRGPAGAGWAVTFVLLAALVLFFSQNILYKHLRDHPWLNSGGLFAAHFGKEYQEEANTPYVLLRQPIAAPDGHSCSPTPWGTVSALNLNTGQSAWETPLGTAIPGQHTGTINVGGPMVTAGGLVFTAASKEPFLRAFNSTTGEELWKGPMPVPSQATPMTYTVKGKQYIVLSDGGHFTFGTAQSDAVIAFALP